MSRHVETAWIPAWLIYAALAMLLPCKTCLGDLLNDLNRKPDFTLRAENIELYSDNQPFVKSLAFAASTASGETDKWFTWRQPHPIPIVLWDEALGQPPEDDVLRLVVSVRSEYEQLFHSLLQILIQRSACEIIDRRLTSVPTSGWLAAALFHRIIIDGKCLTSRYLPDFRCAKALYDQGVFPDFTRLLNKPLVPSDGHFFRLYALHCDVLAAAVEKRIPDRLTFYRRVFDLERYGRLPAEAFSFTLKKQIKNLNDIQTWYEKQVWIESQYGWRQTDVSNLRKQLLEMTVLPVLNAGSSSAITNVDLLKLPEQLRDYSLDPQALSQLQNHFLRLQLEAPLLLHPVFVQFAASIEFLKQKNVRQFKTAFHNAQEEFDRLAERQLQIEALLDKTTGTADVPDFIDITEKYNALREQATVFSEK